MTHKAHKTGAIEEQTKSSSSEAEFESEAEGEFRSSKLEAEFESDLDIEPDSESDIELNSEPEAEIDADAYLIDALKEPEFKEEWENQARSRELGRKVHYRRLELGWSQRELARRAGTSQNYVYRLERGIANPTLENMYKLAKVLGLSFEIRGAESESELTEAAERLVNDVVECYWESCSGPVQDRVKLIPKEELSQEFYKPFVEELEREAKYQLEHLPEAVVLAKSGQQVRVKLFPYCDTGHDRRKMLRRLARETASAYATFLGRQFGYYRRVSEDFDRAEEDAGEKDSRLLPTGAS